MGRRSQYAVISESHRTLIPKECVSQRVFGRSVYERDEVTALILQLLALIWILIRDIYLLTHLSIVCRIALTCLVIVAAVYR